MVGREYARRAYHVGYHVYKEKIPLAAHLTLYQDP